MQIWEKSSTFAVAMRNLPIVTKSLLLANLTMWLLDTILKRYGIELYSLLGLHYWSASQFHWWQPLTYMFMHGNFSHLFFNMFAVLMFAPVLEGEWGVKKFLLYYFVCGIGAAIIQEGVWALRIEHLLATYNAESVMLNYDRCIRSGVWNIVGIWLVISECSDVHHIRSDTYTRAHIRYYICVNRAFCRNCEYVR